MIVLDASVAIDYLLDLRGQAEPIAKRIVDADVGVPHLFDVEVAQVVRRFCRTKQLRVHRAEGALHALQRLPFLRFEHGPLIPRIFALRDELTAYDAAYLALAEALGATLLTRDRAFTAARSTAPVEIWPA